MQSLHDRPNLRKMATQLIDERRKRNWDSEITQSDTYNSYQLFEFIHHFAERMSFFSRFFKGRRRWTRKCASNASSGTLFARRVALDKCEFWTFVRLSNDHPTSDRRRTRSSAP
jgi:hypothetical protein